jgi:uncharacterized protein (DUF302 family)
MYYVVETNKTFEQAAADLETIVKRHGFGVLHVHDLGGTLRSKGIHFEKQCKVFEICLPAQAAKVLAADMRLNMALPCRISVFTDDHKTHIGMIRPIAMMSELSDDPVATQVAKEVEEAMVRMVEEAK